MSLIQRAMQESGVAVVNRADERPRRTAGVTPPPPLPPASATNAAPVPASSLDNRTPPGAGGPIRQFALDYHHLAREGFITPGIGSTKLANEVSGLKRRLLRRMGFFKSFSSRHRSPSGNVVIVTSAMPGEGKTFTATNLALSLTMDERLNVLLIDADFARSSVCEIFGLKGQPGILDRLQNRRLEFTDLLQQAGDLPLSIMPTGSCRMPVAQIFAGNAFGAFVDEISGHFADRVIIIDSPPLLATTEAAVLAEHASQILLIVEAGRSTKETVGSALELLGAEEKISLVLNRAYLGGSSNSRYYGSYRDAGEGDPGEDPAHRLS